VPGLLAGGRGVGVSQKLGQGALRRLQGLPNRVGSCVQLVDLLLQVSLQGLLGCTLCSRVPGLLRSVHFLPLQLALRNAVHKESVQKHLLFLDGLLKRRFLQGDVAAVGRGNLLQTIQNEPEAQNNNNNNNVRLPILQSS